MNEIVIFKNFNAFAIAPFYNESYSSQIWTYQGTVFKSTKTINQLMDSICIHYGANFEGRLKAAREILDIRKNPPVMISDELGLLGCQFPYMNYNEPMWIFDLDIHVHALDKNYSEIEFVNGQKFLIPLSATKVKSRRKNALTLLGETKYCYYNHRYKQMILERNEIYQAKLENLKFQSESIIVDSSTIMK